MIYSKDSCSAAASKISIRSLKSVSTSWLIVDSSGSFKTEELSWAMIMLFGGGDGESLRMIFSKEDKVLDVVLKTSGSVLADVVQTASEAQVSIECQCFV